MSNNSINESYIYFEPSDNKVINKNIETLIKDTFNKEIKENQNFINFMEDQFKKHVEEKFSQYKNYMENEQIKLKNEILLLRHEILTVKESFIEYKSKNLQSLDERDKNKLIRSHIPFSFLPSK